MKIILKILTICIVFSFIVSCASTPTTAPATQAPLGPEPTAAPQLTANEQWAKDNGVGPYQPATDDWAAIEAAAIKEGKITIYANSGGIEDMAEAWNALYPEIVWDGQHTENIDVKMQAEQESGNVVGDVWFNSDGHILYGKFVPNQWMWWFVPRDVVIPELTATYPFASARHSTDVIGYNNNFHPDGCPITNLWQLTESQYKGKFFMEDPISDVSTMAKMATFVQHADEMAAAYQDLYGKAWTTDELAVTDSFGMTVDNAGYLWLKKLAYNGLVILSDGDLVDAAAFGLEQPAGVEPGFGFTGYSTYETTLDGELNMEPCFGLKPAMGVFKTSFLGIANKSQHPNAAKLFIRFALSQEGFAPWSEMGSYSAVEGAPIYEGNMPLADLKAQVYEMDPLFDWNNTSQVRDFIAVQMLAAPKE